MSQNDVIALYGTPEQRYAQVHAEAARIEAMIDAKELPEADPTWTARETANDVTHCDRPSAWAGR